MTDHKKVPNENEVRARAYMDQASHRYHRHDVTGMGSDCEVCVSTLAAEFREVRLVETRLMYHNWNACADRDFGKFALARLAELEANQ